MMKRGLSVFLATTLLILCFFSVPAFAAEPAFDISDYTFEDLESMTTAEKKELIEKFIETYNPYGLRDLMEQETSASYGFGVQPLWKSDGDSTTPIEQEIATHQLVTLEALNVFIEDYGFYNTDGTTMFAIALYLMAASALPDQWEMGVAFAGHFYDPDTGLNYLNDGLSTAATNAYMHYQSAYRKLKKDVNMDLNSDKFTTVLRHLGCCLHYVQDACEPHHASNAVAGVTTHTEFEAYVESNIGTYLTNVPAVPSVLYSNAQSQDLTIITHLAAATAKPYYDSVSDKNDRSKWYATGKTCIRNSVQYSASVIYKLFYACNAPFV